ncbi:MAG: hypothetical protein Q8Q15_00035 [bacterium]|nr:hypothetical protein [bacterium]
MEILRRLRQPVVIKVFPYKEVDGLRHFGFSYSEIARTMQKFVDLGITERTQDGYSLTPRGRVLVFLGELRDLAKKEKVLPEQLSQGKIDQIAKKCGFRNLVEVIRAY